MSTIKGMRGKTMAVLVAACMLLCVLSPAIVNWNEEGSFATDGDDKPVFTYVSLGDSTTNGYGLDDYWPSNDKDMNIRGFLQEAPEAYPSLVRDMLTDAIGDTYDVDLIQLAISGYRPDELRYLIDDDFIPDQTIEEVFSYAPYLDDEGDWNYGWNWDFAFYLEYGPNYRDVIQKELTKLDEAGTLDDFLYECEMALKNKYRDAIISADLITYALGTNNFGTFVTSAIASLLFDGGEGLRVPDLAKYIDPDYVDVYNEFRADIGKVIGGLLVQAGLDINMIGSLGSLLTVVADVFTYGYVSFIANYNATMDIIYELNPEANVLVVPIYNMIEGVNFVYDGITIPIGDIYGFVIESANMYVKYLSPSSIKSTPVEILGASTLLIDEMKAGELSGAAMRGVADEFGFEDIAKGIVKGNLISEGVLVEVDDEIEFDDMMLKVLVATALVPASKGVPVTDVVEFEGKDPKFDQNGIVVKQAYVDIVNGAVALYKSAGVDKLVDDVYVGFCAENDIGDSVDLYMFIDAFSGGKLTQVLQDIACAQDIDLAALLGGLDFDSLVDDLAGYIAGGGDAPPEENFGIYHIYIRSMLADGLFIHPNADGYRQIADAVWDAYEFSLSDESKGAWFDIYEMYLEGGLPFIEAYINGIIMDCKADIDAFIAIVEGHIAELMESALAESKEVIETIGVLQAMVDELKENTLIAIGMIEAGADPYDALLEIDLVEIVSGYAEYLGMLASEGSESAFVAYKLLTSEMVESLLDYYVYLTMNGLDDLEAIVEAVIMQIECKVQSLILAIEEKIAELALYAESQVPGTVATIYVLENAIAELEANLASAMCMVGEYPVSEILEEIGLYEVWEKTNYALMELAGNGADAAKIALVLINSDCIVNMINSYMMAISTFEMVEFTVSMIVEDFSSYTDDEEYYYDSENYLYISNRGMGVPDLGDSVIIDTIMAQLGSITGGLRLMDYVALLTGNQFDGKVAYDDSVMEHIKLLEGAFESSNVIIMDADAGNLMFLLSEILTYEDAEPLDFGIYSGLIGEDATAFLNDIEDMLAPYMDIIEENFPEYAMPAEMLTFLAERLAYMALQTMEGLLYMPGVVNLYNELATLMFVGMHNPLENVFIVDGEDVIPVGEIFDAYVTVFNTLVYELCEEVPGVIYIDVTEMYEVDEPIIIDTSMLNDPEQMGTIFELIAMFDVDIDYIFEQALAYLENLECIPTYDVTWTNYDGTVLDYEYNVVDYEGIEYDGDVPARASDADFDYVFTGEWACEIDGREVTYTALFDDIYNKVDIKGEEGSSDVEFDVTVIGDKDFAKVSVDDFTVVIPAELFAGVETVKVSMKVVEQNDIPGNLLVFTEGKKVISLELFLDGVKTSDFGDNEVTVSVDYTLAEGEDASTLAVWYMNEDTMTLEKVKSEYVDGKLVITMDHFSYWVIGHEVVEDDSEDKAFPAMVAVLLVIVVGLCVALLRLKK